MATAPGHNEQPSTDPYSTLEAVEHYPGLEVHDVKTDNGAQGEGTFSTLELSPLTDKGDRFSTLELSPKTDAGGFETNGEGRYSTLEAYKLQHPDTSEKIAADSAGDTASETPAKENWKRRRVFGVPLLFLIIAAVVLCAVIAAVVGGVVGSKKKSDSQTAENQQNQGAPSTVLITTTASNGLPGQSTTITSISGSPTNADGSTTVASSSGPTQTSVLDSYFAPYPEQWNIGTEFATEPGVLYFLEDSTPHGRQPPEGVYFGEATNDQYQIWQLAAVPEDAVYGPEALWWIRLFNTDLVLSIDIEIYESIYLGNRPNRTREDIPIIVTNFNETDRGQMWEFTKQNALGRQEMESAIPLTVRWTLGKGPEYDAHLLLRTEENALYWQIFNVNSTTS